ncbi:sodium/proton antiporter NhaB [SAR86 cluster bacterium]|jgi:NhaB family Na+:H+ antiporter|nr:sodium/proton antiporter NhaB [Gammaproteobacteria bacterium]MDC3151220.1 sodium/proton antiporter NhaB [SAR86 cluster bacterium]|tara:strand:- start:349 stop:1800 length:1452 start_codon:yes stop_codon:yes gene_type:complete
MLLNFYNNFLGEAPKWYKNLIIIFLASNPLIYIFLSNIISEAGFIMGWIILAQFILTLAMALNCYPLQPGGLIAIQSVLMGLTNTKNIYHEVELNLKVILLLVFMVAGIYFMKDFLLYIFTKLLVNVKNKRTLSVLFVISAAVLSAFLDALTVTAVLIAVAVGFYYVFQEAKKSESDLDQFKAFLRNLLMHGAVGTALGGVSTIVGEPQNLLIGSIAGWNFLEFFIQMLPISFPVFIFGILTCYFIEKFKLFGYGAELSDDLRLVIENFGAEEDKKRTLNDKTKLFTQFAVVIILILSLAFNVASVGLIGLMVIVLLTAFNGIIKEHDLGKAFEEALPFTALLVVFFVIVAVIHDQHLFSPVIGYVLTLNFDLQVPMFFLANGILSMISDNVFVATIYISEVKEALDTGLISREQFDLLAIAINTGTNLPSVATPNGQAAFLFLLTSSIAPLIGLSYLRMVLLALPYTIVLTVVGLFSVIYFL